MTLYFLILAFCLVPAYSYESFIKYANGPTNITCDKNSFFVTNDTKYINCNEKRSCSIRQYANDVPYVCLKKKFKKSGCTELEHGTWVSQTGCYVVKGGRTFEIRLAKNSVKYFHFFVLYMSLSAYYQTGQWRRRYCPAFYYYLYNYEDRIRLDGHSWILLKVSDNSEEDFGEFSMEKNSGTTFMGKEEDTKYPVTTAPTTSILPVNNDTKYPVTTDPPKSILSVNNVIIISGAVVIILLIVFMLAALAFYRKKRQNAKRTLNTEIPLSENDTVNTIPYESTVPTPGQEFNDPLDISVDNVLYETTKSEDQAQLKAQSQSKDKESAQTSDAVYAVVNKNKEIKNDFPIAPGGPPHVVVNGDIYAMVNKEESHYANSPLPDDLIREEVNGEMYTLVNK